MKCFMLILLLTSVFTATSSAPSKSAVFETPSNSTHTDTSNIFSPFSYEQGNGIISVSSNNPIFSIAIYDNMIISMDIAIDSIYRGFAQNIFHIGNTKKDENFPSIFINKKSDNGFKIRMTNRFHKYQTYKTFNKITMDTIYHMEIIYTQNAFTLSLNDDEVVHDMHFASHKLYINKTVYIGDPWHVPAKAHISNLKIFGWNDEMDQKTSEFFLDTVYKKYLSGALPWGILVGFILIFNIGILWYLNCVTVKKYKKAKKESMESWNMTQNEIIEYKIHKMQLEAGYMDSESQSEPEPEINLYL